MSLRSSAYIILVFLLAISCTPKKEQLPEKDSSTAALTLPPPDIEAAIQQAFPGAVPSAIFADSIFNYLKSHYHMEAKDILLGVSTCVDDIIYTKNFHRHPEIKGPFHMGGLAGLPFSGISGLNAFSHHVPEDGVMILMIGPHIGYSAESGWGSMLRPGQREPSSCCGALVGTLSNLEKGNIRPGILEEDDYQGGKISQFALQHSQEILDSPIPLITLTKLISVEAEAEIRRYMPRVDLSHEHYIVAIGMVLINTDYTYFDYVWVTHFKVYDVKNKNFLEDK